MDVEQILRTMPPVTRGILLLSGALAVALTYGVVQPVHVVFSPTLVFRQQEYWRLVTTFFFYDRLSVQFFFHMHWIYLLSSHIERHYFRGRSVDYLCTLLCGCSMLLAARCARVTDVPFLSFSFWMAVMYMWSRFFPHEQVSLYGLIEVSASALPLAMAGMTYCLAGFESTKNDLLGCVVGHILWYLCDIFPRITGFHPLKISTLLDGLIR